MDLDDVIRWLVIYLSIVASVCVWSGEFWGRQAAVAEQKERNIAILVVSHNHIDNDCKQLDSFSFFWYFFLFLLVAWHTTIFPRLTILPHNFSNRRFHRLRFPSFFQSLSCHFIFVRKLVFCLQHSLASDYLENWFPQHLFSCSHYAGKKTKKIPRTRCNLVKRSNYQNRQ